MVGCKDDPSHRLSNVPLFLQQSPTEHERDTRLNHWLHNLPPSPPTSNSVAKEVQDNLASNKRKALTEVEASHPRKSVRLEQKQRISAYKMSTLPLKRRAAGKVRKGAVGGQERNEAKVGIHHIVTRGRSQGKVSTAGSSDKENKGTARDTAIALSRAEGTEIIEPLLQPTEVGVPPDLGSPPKRKDPSSRPTSPTKSTSTKTSRTPARVDKRERLMLLNPPVEFFTPHYLSALGKTIPILLRELWVDHIVSDDEGFIPQSLEVRDLQFCTPVVLILRSAVDSGKDSAANPKQIETENPSILLCKRHSLR